jgi:hypothetical protein
MQLGSVVHQPEEPPLPRYALKRVLAVIFQFELGLSEQVAHATGHQDLICAGQS